MRAAALAALALTTLTAAGLAGPTHSTSKTIPQPRVSLRLTVLGHEPATVRALLGTEVRIVLPDGTNLTLTPDVVGGLQEIAVREGTEGTMTRLWVDENGVTTDSLHQLQIEWIATEQMVREQAGQNGPCTTCCVTCAGVTYCACEVFAPCGHCCCPDTCVCEGQGGREAAASF